MSTQGEQNLIALLSTMSPTLHPDTFVFLTFPLTLEIPQGLDRRMTFLESEGTTIISTKSSAISRGFCLSDSTPDTTTRKQKKRTYDFESRMVTLNVHSSLHAVGFLAVVTTRLAEKIKIGVNPVSGFFHDHLFVPVGIEGEVMDVLQELADDAKSKAYSAEAPVVVS